MGGYLAVLSMTTGCSGDDDGQTTVATASDGTDSSGSTTSSSETTSESATGATAGSASATGSTSGATDSDTSTSGGSTSGGSTSGGSTSGGSTSGGSTSGGSTSGGSTTGLTATSGSTGGSSGGIPDDTDMDGIPDSDDPFPMDKDKPGDLAKSNVVYAQTSSTLYTMDVETPYDVGLVGGFQYDQQSGSMTDIAIDRYGILYGTTFNDLFVCNAATAECWWLADLPQSFNGLTMIPQGIIEPNSDALVAIANSGVWYHVEFGGGTVNLNNIGSYGTGYTNDGDAYSIEGVGTYGATDKTGVTGTVIVEANPANGNVIADLTELPVTTVYGLAGWQGSIFAFDSGGDIYRVDPQNGTHTLIKSTAHTWWGAAVATVLPQ